MSEFLVFLQSHLMIVCAIIIIFIMLCAELISNYLTKKYKLTADDVSIMLSKGAVVIDIRDKSLYKKSHIQNAIWADSKKIQDKPNLKLDFERDNIIYCEKGLVSQEVAENLIKKRGCKVYFLEDGLESWINQGFQVVKGDFKND